MAQNNGRTGASRGKVSVLTRDLFTFSTLTRVPSSIATVRKFVKAVNWNAAQEEVKGELEHKVAILGMANSGKSTLFNALIGANASPVSHMAGTTTTVVRGEFGPFILLDTPGHLPDIQDAAFAEASAIVYLLDASQGLRAQDFAMVTKLRTSTKPLIVALNKADMLRGGADDAAAEAAARLHITDVIPISARIGDNVGEELIPAIIETSPEAALTLGRLLPEFRRSAANKLVRTASLVSLAAGLEPIPLVDIPILLGTQVRLVLRIAAVYNEPLASQYARELFVTVAGGLGMRYLAEQAAKAVPFGGDFVSGLIAGAGTWTIGQVAIEYFEGGKQFSRRQINDLFARFYHRFREENIARQLMETQRVAAASAAAPASESRPAGDSVSA